MLVEIDSGDVGEEWWWGIVVKVGEWWGVRLREW